MFQNFTFKTWHILLLVMLGSVFRVFYGAYAKAWLGAPDQLAWELGLQEMLKSGEWTYKQIAHYPHEGGSFLIGLFALLFTSLSTSLPALSITALLIDTSSRLIQILIAKKLFGNQTALFFSLWSVFSVPLLISWSSVNLGLHHLSSFWPFVFLLAISHYQGKKKEAVLIGLLCGFALSFSYNSVILIPAYVICLFFISTNLSLRITSLLFYLLGFSIAFAPHVLLRTFIDTGFHLEHLSGLEIREFSPGDLISWQSFKNVFLVGFLPLPASFFLSTGGIVLSLLQHLFVLILLIVSVVAFFRRLPAVNSQEKLLPVLIILYLVVYALSPFYAGSPRSGSYNYYRHLAYILPLLMLFVAHEFLFLGSPGRLVLFLCLGLSFTFTAIYCYTTKPPTRIFIREEGWILSLKYGEDPVKMMQLLRVAEIEQQKELNIGFGSGTTAALFSNKTSKDSSVLNEFLRIYQNYPEANRPDFHQGVRIAFQSGNTPKLDPRILPAIEEKINTFVKP